MSKLVVICHRDRRDEDDETKIRVITSRITPDNIEPKSPTIVKKDGLLTAVINPISDIVEKNGNICLGKIVGDGAKWFEVNGETPDGLYTLARSDNKFLEIVSDLAGSRTVWYFKDDRTFVAATTQRALVILLQSFNVNTKVYPWMLSSGILGVEQSWDARLKVLRPNSKLILDRNEWKLSLVSELYGETQTDVSPGDCEEKLRSSIEQTFDQLDLKEGSWVLPLSGGYDSRALLLFLLRKQKIKTITWGTQDSLRGKNNDAVIARQVAEYYGVENNFYETGLAAESIEKIFQRFICAGEGRVDHVGAYLDGFKIWKSLYEDGYDGVIRGDHLIGRWTTGSEIDAKKANGFYLLGDFENMRDAEEYGLEKQEVPQQLIKDKQETWTDYREKLYLNYRIPYVLSPLNDLKNSYVEVLSPLLSRNLASLSLSLSDECRINKTVYKKIIEEMVTAPIPFTKRPSILQSGNIYSNTDVVAFLREQMSSREISAVLPDELIADISRNMSLQENTRENGRGMKLINKVRNKIDKRYKDRLAVNYVRLAFRAYIIGRMTQTMREDSVALGKS